jgi:hypothetical protein
MMLKLFCLFFVAALAGDSKGDQEDLTDGNMGMGNGKRFLRTKMNGPLTVVNAQGQVQQTLDITKGDKSMTWDGNVKHGSYDKVGSGFHFQANSYRTMETGESVSDPTTLDPTNLPSAPKSVSLTPGHLKWSNLLEVTPTSTTDQLRFCFKLEHNDDKEGQGSDGMGNKYKVSSTNGAVEFPGVWHCKSSDTDADLTLPLGTGLIGDKDSVCFSFNLTGCFNSTSASKIELYYDPTLDFAAAGHVLPSLLFVALLFWA